MPALHLRPGVPVRLKLQPAHLPDFWVMHCTSDRVWIRQPDWPSHIQLCIPIVKLAIPADPPFTADKPVPIPIRSWVDRL